MELTDDLIVFEGATGQMDNKEPAWSPMGYVLKRQTSTGYQVHIVFRGSRSGNGMRAALQSGVQSKGNPDWVTDLDGDLVANTNICGQANTTVSRGFANAFQRCRGSLQAALSWVKTSAGDVAPERITVSGHSLGAALACMTFSAIHYGADWSSTGASGLATLFPGWPFAQTRAYCFALPPVGNKEFSTAIEGKTISIPREGGSPLVKPLMESPWITGDEVVGVAANIKGNVGQWFKQKAAKVGSSYSPRSPNCGLPMPPTAAKNEHPHEMYLIRQAIALGCESLVNERLKYARPWATHLCLRDVLDGVCVSTAHAYSAQPTVVTRTNLKGILRNYRFTKHLQIYGHVLTTVLGNSEGWKGIHTKNTYKNVQTGIGAAYATAVADPFDADAMIRSFLAMATAVPVQPGVKTPRGDLVRTGRQDWVVTEPPNTAPEVPACLREMLGLEFSLRICLGFPLAAFEVDATNADFSAYERSGPSQLCCLMMMPRWETEMQDAARKDAAAGIRTRPRSGAVIRYREKGPTG